MHKDPIKDHIKYHKFLESIPLVKFREELKDVKEDYLKPIIDNIDNFEKLKGLINKISSELAGES